MTESSRGEHLVDILIAIARSEYPQEWSRYGELAQKISQGADEQALEFSAEDRARRLLVGHYQRVIAKGLRDNWLSQVVSGVPSEFQKMTEDATRLEQIFRIRLISSLHAGEYSLTGYDPDLRPISIPPVLITPELLLFDSDEIQLGNKLIIDVRATRILPESSNPPAPGPKPGQATQKDRVFDAARAILDDDAKRPPKGRGRLARIVQMVQESYLPAGIGIRYKLNTIERMIRPALKEWEKFNPDK